MAERKFQISPRFPIVQQLHRRHPEITQTMQKLDLAMEFLVYQYLTSPLFTAAENKISSMIDNGTIVNRRVPDYTGISRSAVFEGLSYYYLQPCLEPGEILTTPEQTSDIFQAYGFNIHSADGLILSPDYRRKMTLISGVTEYTTCVKITDRKLRQSEGFESRSVLQCFDEPTRSREPSLAMYISGKFPHLPPVIGYDKDRYRVLYTHLGDAEEVQPQKHVYPLPITSDQLSTISSILLKSGRPLVA